MGRKAKTITTHSSRVTRHEFVQVAAAVIEHDDRYLVTRRKAGTHLAGLWEFPGGKCESDESLEQCLTRELREELCIEIGAPILWQIVTHAYPDKTVRLHFFRCAIAQGEPVSLGCDEVRWVTAPELTTLEFPPADREVIRRLQETSSQSHEVPD
jgi:mutator protein MutT